MALVSIARHGYSAAGGNMDGVPPQGRGGSRGWSKRSRKSNEEFLQSIDFHGLSGSPYAVTLTLPTTRTPDAAEFHAMLKAYLMRLKRYGAIRWHWLIEWTNKHQPHTHMVVWVPADWIFFEVDAKVVWLEIAKKHGFECRLTAQDVKRVTSVGWLQYVAKHGAKSVHAAQRENLPAVGWETPGRVWGYGPRSAWPSKANREPMRFDLPQPAFWKLRRLCRSYAIAQARLSRHDEGYAARIRAARRMLQAPKEQSPYRGCSGWVPEDVMLTYLNMLMDEGYNVEQVEKTRDDEGHVKYL